jgi:hypothetical protein
MDMKVEQLPRDFIAASHVARVAIQLANTEQSTPEQELNRAWRLIEVAQEWFENMRVFARCRQSRLRSPKSLRRSLCRCPGRESDARLAVFRARRCISSRRLGKLE